MQFDLIFLIVGISGLGYISLRLARLNLFRTIVESPSGRYSLYLPLALLATFLFGTLGANTGNNWLNYLAASSGKLFAYFALVWVIIIITPTPVNLRIKKVAEVAFLVTEVLELALFSLAGKTAFDSLSTAKGTELVINGWLFLSGVVVVLYVTACMIGFFLLLWRHIHKPITLYSKYRCTLFATGGLLAVASCLFNLLDLFILAITHTKDTERLFLNLKNSVGNLALLLVIIISFLDKPFFKLYQRYYERRICRMLEQLRWLYEKGNELYPAAYITNPYLSDDTPEWSLEAVVDTLGDVRTSLWRADLWLRAEDSGSPVETLLPSPVSSLKEEVALWSRYLQNPAEVLRVAVKMGVDGAVPLLNDTNILKAGRFYCRLAFKVKQNLRE